MRSTGFDNCFCRCETAPNLDTFNGLLDIDTDMSTKKAACVYHLH